MASIVQGIGGLYTFPSDTTKVPNGAMLLCEDVALDKEGLAEPRPGWPLATTWQGGGPSKPPAKKLFAYGAILIMVDTFNHVWTFDGSTWTDMGAYAGLPVRPPGFEAVGNFYLGTAAGFQVMDSPTATPSPAGVPVALDMQVSLALTNGGPILHNSQAAYRYLFGIRDANNNVKLGGVSQRATVTNPDSNNYTAGNLSKPNTSDLVTATSPQAHGLKPGQFITVTLGGAETYFAGGTFQVFNVIDSTHFTYHDGLTNSSGSTQTNVQTDTIAPTDSNATVTVRIPDTVTTSHFLQVYRTQNSATAATDPGDSEQQVHEHAITQADLDNGTYTFTDITPDQVLGQDLYTNSNQEGIAANNFPPPLAYDAVMFKDSAFYLRTQSKQRLYLTLLGVDFLGPLAGTQIQFGVGLASNFAVPGTSPYFTLHASTSTQNTSGFFIVYTDGTPSQNTARTAQAMVQAINAHTGNSKINAYYLSGPDDAPGKIMLEARSLGDPAFDFYLANFLFHVAGQPNTVCEAFSPTIPFQVVSFNPLVRTGGNTVTVTPAAGIGEFMVGQQVNIQPTGTLDANFPAGLKTIDSVGSFTFTYLESGANVTATQNYWVATPSAVNGTSIFDDAPNGLFWSKPRQPEAVPLAQNARPGSAQKALLKGVALRNSLFLFKEDGLWRLTGSFPNWDLQVFDPTVKLLCAESAVALSNCVFALTSQGLAKISDTGVEIISRPVEDLLPKLADTGTVSKTFAVSRESRHEYLLFLSVNNQPPAFALRYNDFTGKWARWNLGRGAGVVGPTTDRLFLSYASVAGLTAEASQTVGDPLAYYDNLINTFNLNSQNLGAKTVTLSSVIGISVGDTFSDGGSQFSTITAINGNTLTLTDGFTWPGSGNVVYTAIASVIQWARQTAGEPRQFKHWQKLWLDFKEAAFQAMTAALSSELATTPVNIGLLGTGGFATGVSSGVSKPIGTLVTPEAARSVQLTVKITIKNALAYWQLRGMEVEYRQTKGAQR